MLGPGIPKPTACCQRSKRNDTLGVTSLGPLFKISVELSVFGRVPLIVQVLILFFLALLPVQLPSHSITPSSKHADSKPVPLTPAYHTLPHPSHHGTPHTTISWGPLEPPKTPKPWSLSCLRPAPPLRPSAALCYKEVRSM